ncbi:anhydro-N-acetylmuramic acid kinase [Flavobacterium algicola]|uniref:anhydro-N-acetylmuramic acid kinase n=1 Tax=Flavobacterium algicola TaxID=556529 RepID=UPI001EFD4845|nr:anhydro-N-acetylmuramic acid kinase [Flavobacterium algicola]MCG9794028.1 anhydro-N-acetylmuramic acid kinase [Flavobacterium algicola]
MTKKDNYHVLGVMSGTSLDGVDLAQIHFTIIDNQWSFDIIQSETIAYNGSWLSILKNAVTFSHGQIQELNRDYTQLLSSIILNFVSKHKIENLDAICSHGHTILHQPQDGFTLQIGNLPEIANLLQQTVVCDFRVQDIKLGGQGAPLVPIGDQILFSSYNYCMNLGGFSNVSFAENGKRIAFDISPVNTILNFYANKLNLEYDDKGAIARTGEVDQLLLEQLNALEFYQKKHPKSLGFEFVKEVVLPIMESFDISIKNKLATFIEHVATQTAHALPKKSGTLLATGGGAYNEYLIERIQHHLPKLQIIIPENKILEYKEAVIFALLGVLKLRDEVNVLSSVTGASRDHSSGIIYPI